MSRFTSTTAATEVVENGLYQKTDNGQGVTIYDRVPTESVRHRDQIGPPLVAPNKGGLLDTDDLGRIWSAAGQVFRVLTPPTGDSEVMSLPTWGRSTSRTRRATPTCRTGAARALGTSCVLAITIVQIQGPALSDLVLVLTWIDVSGIGWWAT